MEKQTGIISFTSDFGIEDGYTGIVKGVIKSINPSAEIIDLSHQIKPFDVLQGAWIISNSYSFFPENSIHLVIVDPAVGSRQRRILLTNKRHHFIGPDSGVFSLLLNNRSESWKSFELTNQTLLLNQISTSFHARDIFGPIAAHLSLGRKPEEVGPEIEVDSLNRSACQTVKKDGKKIEGEILYIDRFGNLITNIPVSLVAPAVSNVSSVSIKDITINEVSTTYSAVEKEELLVFPGSHGFIEIAVNQGSAEKKLAVSTGEPVWVETIN